MAEATKLLIIDDDVTLVNALKLYLSKEGYEVITTSNGLEGLQALYNQRPDLVVLDIMMPKMDGLKVLKKLKENKKTQNIPVIMLTAKNDEASINDAIGSYSEQYIIKPIEMATLESKIKNVLTVRALAG